MLVIQKKSQAMVNAEEAVQAIGHILQRVKESSDFAWYMLHTESLRLCVNAFAHNKGCTTAAVETSSRPSKPSKPH